MLADGFGHLIQGYFALFLESTIVFASPIQGC